ncbi:MAG: protein kinase [Acidimicrobiales bacterium]
MTTAEELGIPGLEDVELLDIVGSRVIRARQPAHNRQVAVKILDPLQEPLLPRRFDPRRKALKRFAAGPGVVAVLGAGTTAHGQPYLIMPYFRIGSLGDQLAHGPMPWHRASGLVVKAAEIVGRAHDLGVVLGDLTPSNILLADASSPLVAVYGMATRRFDDGSPTYHAPEAQPGAELLPAADVYSLSLVLAAVIAGRAPNRGTPSAEFRHRVAAMAPERIVDVIDRGLAESPRSRYVNARQFAVALSGAVEEPGPTGGTNDDTDFDLDEILGPPTAELAPPHRPDIDLVASEGRPAGRPSPAESAVLGRSYAIGAGSRNGNGVGSERSGRVVGVGPGDGVEGFADTAAGIDLDWRSDDAFLAETSNTDRVVAPTAAPPPLPPASPRPSSAPPVEAEPATGRLLPPTLEVRAPVADAAPPLPTPPTGDEELPFRAFDRQRVPTAPAGRLGGLTEAAQILWFNGRRSLGGLLALASFAAIAVIIGLLIYRDLRVVDDESGLEPPTIPSSTVAERAAGPVLVPAAEVPPVPIEPPPTHRSPTAGPSPAVSTTVRDMARKSAPAVRADPAPPSTVGAADPQPTPTRPATTAPPSTTIPPVTTVAPTTTLDVAGPTEPVIGSLDVSRIRATTARITVSSASCVSVTFTYGPAGGGTGQTSSSNCSQSHTLLLGVVTPGLQPGTTYQVTVAATDPGGATSSRQLSFTTQG